MCCVSATAWWENRETETSDLNLNNVILLKKRRKNTHEKNAVTVKMIQPSLQMRCIGKISNLPAVWNKQMKQEQIQ